MSTKEIAVNAVQLGKYIDMLGFKCEKGFVTADYLLAACVQFPSEMAQEDVDRFVQANVANGCLQPFVSQNDVLFFKETAKSTSIPLINKLAMYDNFFDTLLSGYATKILNIKQNFKTAKQMREQLGALFRDIILTNVKTPLDEIHNQNRLYQMKHMASGYTDSLFLLYFIQNLGNLDKVKSLLSDHIPSIEKISVGTDYVKMGCFEINIHQQGEYPTTFCVSRSGVICLSTGYWTTSAHTQGWAHPHFHRNAASSVRIAKFFLDIIHRTTDNIHAFRKLSELDAQDTKRLDRLRRYALGAPIEANKYVGIQEDKIGFILSYKGTNILIHPKYCVLLNTYQFLFVRKTTNGTPLRNVLEVLIPNVHASHLPPELKDYLSRMYTVSTDLRSSL